jgi:hypothetical protein
MGLETATYVSSLVATNPTGADQKRQGDDHLRLIKSTLQATFPNADKPWYFPNTTTEAINFSIASTDQNKTFLIDTTAGTLIATLPTLTSTDDGWECFFIKTNTGTSPLLITPASGTIQSGDQSGLGSTRRVIPGVRTRVFWTGTAWIAERAVNVPVGTVLDCPRTGKPVGYEWADGSTPAFPDVLYPDYYKANGNSGVLPDRQGVTVFGRTNMDGSDNGKVTTAGSGLDGTTLGAMGGSQNVTLSRANLPSTNIDVTITDTGHTHTLTPASGSTFTTFKSGAGGSFNNTTTGGGTSVNYTGSATIAVNTTTGITAAFNLNGAVTQTVVNSMPPAVITNFIVVVE